ncbi:MAG: hypothetical protein EOO54_03780 [Haliea sp.]|nr:MAG: hypothetical protein EOO54_03780 [Haliea sp.]
MKPAHVVLLVIALCVSGGLAFVARNTPHDDTDPPGERSGLRLYTDHRTGCQYLSASGGLIRREGVPCHP